MSKEMRFLVFAIEHYRQAKGLTGPEVAALFREKGLSQYVLDNLSYMDLYPFLLRFDDDDS